MRPRHVHPAVAQNTSSTIAKTAIAVAMTFAVVFATSPARAAETLTVMTSGGYAHVYNEVLPVFERTSGIKVTTLSGASQGTGPKTIKSQLEHGVEADVVILSGEGLKKLIAAGLIDDGSAVPLAKTPLGAAVRQGRPKPDIGNVASFKQALIDARVVAMPGSTSGIFVKDEVLPKLGVGDKVSLKFVARGLESTAMLAAGDANMALGPASELVDQPGIEFVGVLPAEIQLLQVFTAATTKTSRRSAEAKKLTDFLTSDQTVAAIGKAGMQPAAPGR